MINEVASWLADPKKTYAKGLEIYNKYKHTSKFDEYFTQVHEPRLNSMHFKLLIKRVSDINRKLLRNSKKVKPESTVKQTIEVKQISSKKSTAGKKSTEPKRPRIVDNPLVDIKELPEDLKQKYFENKELTKQISGKHQKLKNAKTDEERKVIAGDIASLDNKRADNWKAIDTWWSENKKGSKIEKKEDELTPMQIAAKVSNLKNYIRKNRAKLKEVDLNAEKRKQIADKIEKWQKQLNEFRGEK